VTVTGQPGQFLVALPRGCRTGRASTSPTARSRPRRTASRSRRARRPQPPRQLGLERTRRAVTTASRRRDLRPGNPGSRVPADVTTTFLAEVWQSARRKSAEDPRTATDSHTGDLVEARRRNGCSVTSKSHVGSSPLASRGHRSRITSEHGFPFGADASPRSSPDCPPRPASTTEGQHWRSS
jgi:hypothetical protein